MTVLSSGDYLMLLARIGEKGEIDISELSSNTEVAKKDLARALRALKKNMAVDFHENKVKLTELGKFALEKRT